MWGEFRRIIENPFILKNAPAQLRVEIFRTLLKFNKFYYNIIGEDGIDMISEDWDFLLLLDGCRYDLLNEKSLDDWEVNPIISPGSESSRFIEETFVGKDLQDIVYITANPHVEKFDLNFHHIENLLATNWDDDLHTVHPEDVADATRTCLVEFPNKRIISHFMQPHFPFIGDFGQSFKHGGADMHLPDNERHHAVNPWFGIWRGTYEADDIIRGYKENLDIILPIIIQLVDDLQEEGKTVISADHGNLLGERGMPIPIPMYGHPPRLQHPNLVTVPWVEIDGGNRRKIEAESQKRQQESLSDEGLTEKLTALGYRTE